MIKQFEFYFDFGSPYSFIAHKKIREIENKNSIKIKYMPILLGGLLKAAGIKPNVDIPIKGKYMIKDCKLWAEKYGITFKFNRGYFSFQLIKDFFAIQKKVDLVHFQFPLVEILPLTLLTRKTKILQYNCLPAFVPNNFLASKILPSLSPKCTPSAFILLARSNLSFNINGTLYFLHIGISFLEAEIIKSSSIFLSLS